MEKFSYSNYYDKSNINVLTLCLWENFWLGLKLLKPVYTYYCHKVKHITFDIRNGMNGNF